MAIRASILVRLLDGGWRERMPGLNGLDNTLECVN